MVISAIHAPEHRLLEVYTEWIRTKNAYIAVELLLCSVLFHQSGLSADMLELCTVAHHNLSENNMYNSICETIKFHCIQIAGKLYQDLPNLL